LASTGDQISALASEIEESHFIKCLREDLKQQMMSANCLKKHTNISTSSCILLCGIMKLPLAFVDDVTSTCICGRFTQE